MQCYVISKNTGDHLSDPSDHATVIKIDDKTASKKPHEAVDK
jgi:hypothetical protein